MEESETEGKGPDQGDTVPPTPDPTLGPTPEAPSPPGESPDADVDASAAPEPVASVWPTEPLIIEDAETLPATGFSPGVVFLLVVIALFVMSAGIGARLRVRRRDEW